MVPLSGPIWSIHVHMAATISEVIKINNYRSFEAVRRLDFVQKLVLNSTI